MTITGKLASETVALLSANPDFKDLTFVLAYENEIKPTPVVKPICAVSVQNVNIGEKLILALPSGQFQESDTRYVDTCLSIDIYLPYSKGGNEGHMIFDRIATHLIYEKDLNITKATCYDASYVKACDSIVVRSHFIFHDKASA